MWLLGRRFSFSLRASNYQGHVRKAALLPHPQRVPEGRSGLCHFLKVYLFICLFVTKAICVHHRRLGRHKKHEDWKEKSFIFSARYDCWQHLEAWTAQTLVWKGAHVIYTSFNVSFHLLPNYKSNTYLLQKRQKNHHKKNLKASSSLTQEEVTITKQFHWIWHSKTRSRKNLQGKVRKTVLCHVCI